MIWEKSRAVCRGLRALVFDFDGVVADTEPHHYDALHAALEPEGIVISPQQNAESFVGVNDEGCVHLAFEAAGRPLSPQLCDEIVARKGRIYRDRLGQVRLFGGVTELIDAAADHVALAIASGAFHDEIVTILECDGLQRHFPVIVSSSDGVRSKPHPEPFLRALEKLQRQGVPDLSASECLVIEDSPRGVEAAARAGMRCAAVTNTFAAAHLEAADWVVESLHDVAAALAEAP